MKSVFRARRVCALGPVGVMLSLLAAGACAHAKAKTAPEVPIGLDVPAPPPRDVEASEPEPQTPIIPLPQEPARNTPARARPSTPAQPRPETRPEPPKVEPPAETETPKPEENPKPPLLQTPQSQNEAETERSIRDMLKKAAGDLNRVDYRQLNADARTQYDTAKSFIEQADKAVRAKNLVFAKTLAEKAAALATQLGGK